MAVRGARVRRTAATNRLVAEQVAEQAAAERAAAEGSARSAAGSERATGDVLATEVLAVPPDAMGTTARVGFAPIVRVDAARREVELCATSEAVDSYGTVFDYAASKDAFTRWLGNVREMHERRAVGRRVGVSCDDADRKIYVRVRISRGAEDTWEKVLDGTLRGASIGATNVVWSRQVRSVAGQERQLQVATRYDLVELSLVDNPSNPDALGITLVRDAVPDAAVLDDLAASSSTVPQREGEGGRSLTPSPFPPRQEEEPDGPLSPDVCPVRGGEEPASRAAAASGLMEAQLDNLVARGLVCRLPAEGAGTGRTSARAEPLEVEARAQGPFSSNAEGYPDVGVPERAAEQPTSALGMGGPDGNARERFHAAARAILAGCGCPLCEGALAALGEDSAGGTSAARAAGGRDDAREDALARALAASLGASVDRLERMDASVRGLGATVQSAVTSAVRAAIEHAASATSGLERRIEALEAQPLPGGPALRAAEKTHPLLGAGMGLTGAAGQPGPSEQYRALESLAGRLTDPQAQIAVAAEMIRLQRGE